MKKLLILGLVLTLLLCLVACGGDEEAETGAPTDTVTDTESSEGTPDESNRTEGEETFSPDLNLTEIDRFD